MGGDVNLEITGEESGLEAALAKSTQAVVQASAQMKEAIGGVAEAFKFVNEAAVAIGVALAGGAAFSEAIKASAGAAYSALELGRQLGITATQASILKVAMDENFVSSEAVTTASNKIATTLKKNEKAFTDLGVATRDSNGNFRDSFSIMQDVNERLSEFKEGTDRNVEGQKIYGRSWMSVMDTVRITGEEMAKAKTKADALGLTVGKEGVAQALAYKTSLAGVHTVLDAMEKVVGDALVPVLTKMGEWFSSVGPQAVNIMRASIYAIYAAFSGLGEVGQVAIDAIGGSLEWLGAQFTRLASTAAAVLNFDFSGAKAAWAEGTANIAAKSSAMAAKIKSDIKDATDARDKFFDSQGAQQSPIQQKTGTASSGEEVASLLAQLQEKLAVIKANYAEQQAAQGSFGEYSKTQERDYWQEILNTTNLSKADQIAVRRKIAEDSIAIAKEQYQAELAQLKASEQQYKSNLEAKLSIAQQYAARTKASADAGGDRKIAAQAAGEVLAIERELAAQRLQIAETEQAAEDKLALFGIQSRELAAQQAVAMGLKSNASLLADQAKFEDQIYAIESAGLQRKLTLEMNDPDRNPVKVAQLNAQVEQLATQHSLRMQQITNKSILDQQKDWRALFSSMQSGFATVIGNFLKGTASLGATVKGLFSSVATSVADTLAQMAAKNIATMLEQAVVGQAIRSKEILGDAYKAASGAYSAVVGIPYVGPFLAPAAAAVAFGAVMAFDKSALGGYDIPPGVNPVVQTHAEEMILPPPLANAVRDMTKNGGGAGGSPVQVNISATDAKSVRRMIVRNAPQYASAFQKLGARLQPRYR